MSMLESLLLGSGVLTSTSVSECSSQLLSSTFLILVLPFLFVFFCGCPQMGCRKSHRFRYWDPVVAMSDELDDSEIPQLLEEPSFSSKTLGSVMMNGLAVSSSFVCNPFAYCMDCLQLLHHASS